MWKQWQILFSWARKSLQMVAAATKLKDICFLEEKPWQTISSFSCSVVSNSLWSYGLQHAGDSLSITNSQSLLKLMSVKSVMPPQPFHPVIPFSSCLQSFPASGSFPVSQFFTSGGQSIGSLASPSVLSMNIQDWFPLEWTVWISLQSKGLSRVISNTTVQKHQFFGAQLSLLSKSHIHTWLLEKP